MIAQPITAETFAPFGRLLSLQQARDANHGTAKRADFAAEPKNLRSDARANLAVFRCQPIHARPLSIVRFERHAYSTQTFIPLRVGRYVVIVAPPGDDGPAVAQARAFVCGAGQAVHYDVGVWHHPMIALDVEAEFVMLAYENGSAGDCDDRLIDNPFTIDLG